MGFLGNVKVGYRISGVMAIILGLMLIVGIFSFAKMNNIVGEIKDIAENDMPLMEVTTEITINQPEQVRLIERAVRLSSNGDTEKTKKTIQEFEKFAKLVEKEIKQGEQIAQHGLKTANSDEAKKEFTHVLSQLKSIEKEHKKFDRHATKIFNKLEHGSTDKVEALMEKI